MGRACGPRPPPPISLSLPFPSLLISRWRRPRALSPSDDPPSDSYTEDSARAHNSSGGDDSSSDDDSVAGGDAPGSSTDDTAAEDGNGADDEEHGPGGQIRAGEAVGAERAVSMEVAGSGEPKAEAVVCFAFSMQDL